MRLEGGWAMEVRDEMDRRKEVEQGEILVGGGGVRLEGKSNVH